MLFRHYGNKKIYRILEKPIYTGYETIDDISSLFLKLTWYQDKLTWYQDIQTLKIFCRQTSEFYGKVNDNGNEVLRFQPIENISEDEYYTTLVNQSELSELNE